MKYRTKLFVSIMVTVLVGDLLLFSLMYKQAHSSLFREIQSKAMSIAGSAATEVDGGLLATIKSPEDMDSDNYITIRDILRRVRDANRRDDTQVAYIYSMAYSPDDPSKVIFGVDADEDPSEPGDVYEGSFGTAFEVADRYFAEDVPSVDEWGVWISGYAPVKDASGKVVAMIGVDLKYDDVRQKTTVMLVKWGVLSLCISVLVGVLIASTLASHVSRPLSMLHKTVETIGQGDLDARADTSGRDEFGQLAAAVNDMAEGLKQRDMLKGVFAKYVSAHVLENILDDPDAISIQGERRKVTALFSDIRGFTGISESMRPEDVVAMLNEYFEQMVDIVFKHGGTLDKFMGDGIMAVFGAPKADDFQEEHAIMAAVDMRSKLEELCDKWESEGRRSIQIGIGINTGTAVVGNVGSMQHMEYTAIGDTVNVASRLESLTKELDVDILVSEYTYVAVRSIVEAERVDQIRVRGKSEPLAVYKVRGLRTQP